MAYLLVLTRNLEVGTEFLEGLV